MTQFPETLLERHRQFIRDYYDKERFQALADQQKPEIMVIACCDSRVAPEIVFNATPGELFVVRNVANIVPPYETNGQHHAISSAVEFAILGLNIRHIVIMGHARCGGIQAILNPIDQPLSPGDYIGKWMDVIRPLSQKITAKSASEKQALLEKTSILHSLKNLREFPCVHLLEKQNLLHLHGAWFDIRSGELWVLDPEKNEFICNPIEIRTKGKLHSSSYNFFRR
ncbi:carbonic anhydrase [Candidatus Liberibacter sp.]|uniref:carbonic anhydrase n=1 Tax=Candidatus Liberibacter sp. TaxID=34022 RepID=UPI0015F35847|nr:carbonic anhydrase [Candidatus Liberibacter sp.]MBA5723641.1 carbonic anhydrase [Candidatus Liberibacter sp.]